MFLVTVLNDLDVFVCDIGNAYLNVSCHTKILFEVGTECVESLKGESMHLKMALYSLKSSYALSRNMFEEFI